jgi:hypothetical protein
MVDMESLIKKDCYVYFLKDSLTGEIFYVGKGKNERAYNHLKEYHRGIYYNPKKTAKISSIVAAGGTVVVEIFQNSLTEESACKIEKAKILEIGLANLTNISPGRMSHIEKSKIKARNLLDSLPSWDAIKNKSKIYIECYQLLIRELAKMAKQGDPGCITIISRQSNVSL